MGARAQIGAVSNQRSAISDQGSANRKGCWNHEWTRMNRMRTEQAPFVCIGVHSWFHFHPCSSVSIRGSALSPFDIQLSTFDSRLCPLLFSSPMTAITLKNLTKKFGSTVAVDGVNLEIKSGELFFLLGPSGCGKTTLLRMIAGFIEPTAGSIRFGEKDVTLLAPN